MKTCRELLNKYFITTKGYDPENRFLPSNEQNFIYDEMKKEIDRLTLLVDGIYNIDTKFEGTVSTTKCWYLAIMEEIEEFNKTNSTRGSSDE